MKYFITLFLSAFFFTSSFASEPDGVIEENDFQQLSKYMEKNGLGLLLFLHAEFCPYCAQMENEILAPMVKSGEYDDRIIIRKLQIDEARDVINFKGETVEPSDISDVYGAKLTPTLLFLDYKGEEKAKQMVGINTVELFGAYLDAEIDNLVSNLTSDSS